MRGKTAFLLLSLSAAVGPAAGAPVAVVTADVVGGSPPLLVHFDGSASTGEPGPLTFAWDLDFDGAADDSDEPGPSWVYTVPGVYRVGLVVTDAARLSAATFLLVTVGNNPPVPTISIPGPSDTWSAGQLLQVAGQASDLEDGSLSSDAMSWEVRVHECDGGCTVSPVATISGATGSFVAPDVAYPSHLELCLTAHDSGFPADTTTVWSYRRKITIDADKVPGLNRHRRKKSDATVPRHPDRAQGGSHPTQVAPLIDFPLLVDLVAQDLRSNANGGGVANADGSDIVFATAGGVRLDHEVERYDPVAGSLVAWVRLPQLDVGVNTEIYLYYGNHVAPPQEHGEAVWRAQYAGVWHLGETPGNQGFVRDSTGHGIDGVLHDADGSTSLAVPFRIGAALELDGFEDFVDLGFPSELPAGASPRTLCAWGRSSIVDTYRWLAAWGSATYGGAFFIGAGLGGDLLQGGTFGNDLFHASFWHPDEWNQVCLTHDGTVGRMYANGNLVAAQIASWSTVPGRAYLGRQVTDEEYWSGAIDEVRIVSRALSPAWILTEWANQSSPSTFYAVGPQEGVPTSLPMVGGGTLSTTTCRDLEPASVDLLFATTPSGLALTVDGKTGTTPFQRTAIPGSSVSIAAGLSHDVQGVTYHWGEWSDEGAAAHTITVPAVPTTYTAAYYRITIGSLLEEMADLQRLAEELDPPRREHVASGRDPASNAPCQPDQPCWFANVDAGQYLGVEVHDGRTEHVMLDASGPGVVEHIWSANPSGTLRIYIDGAEEPVLEQPFWSLFDASVPFLPPLTHPAFSLNLYFPIPFATHCKITHELEGPGLELFYRVAYRLYTAPVSIQSFSMANALTRTEEVLAAADVLSDPDLAYEPSSQHVRISGAVQANAGPTSLSPSGLPTPNAIVRELRLRPQSTGEASLRQTLLSIRFDGKEAVRAPLGDFFGTGPGLNPYESLPFSVRSDGTMICRWPMPFQQSMTIELLRAAGEPIVVEYEAFLEPYTWTASSLLFHGKWRYDYDVYPHGPQDWNFVTVAGRGHYVGSALNVANPFLIWWGEGDEKVFVDSETYPSVASCGTEDYYAYGWGMTDTFAFAYHAQPRGEGIPGQNFGHSSVNRFHVFDSIPFDSELRFDMEQMFSIQTTIERRILYDVMNYYYANSAATDNMPVLDPSELEIPAIPPLQEKVLPGIVIEGEAMGSQADTGILGDQNMQSWELGGTLWSGHFQNLWIFGQPGDVMRLTFPVSEAGTYCVQGFPTQGNDQAILDFEINGGPAAAGVDFFAVQGPLPGPAFNLGVHGLLAGPNEIEATIVGANPQSPAPDAYFFGLDAISLFPATAPALSISVSRTALEWGPLSATEYEVVTGDLNLLLANGGNFTQAVTACLADAYTQASLRYAAIPPPGSVLFFLVRGNHCVDGTFDSTGSTQVGSRDLEVLASPNACPP